MLAVVEMKTKYAKCQIFFTPVQETGPGLPRSMYRSLHKFMILLVVIKLVN